MGHTDSTDATEVKYRITIHFDRKEAVENVEFIAHDSWLTLDTTHPPAAAASKPYCKRFDVDIYVPPNVKRFGINSKSDPHVSFPPGTRITNVEHLEISLAGSSKNNTIRPISDVLT